MNNPYNEEAIQIYTGEKRSTKTLSMVADTYILIKDLKVQPIIYANFNLNKKYFPTFKLITYSEVENFYENKEDFKQCIFLIDEAHTFFDARKFMKNHNIKFSYLVGQMGKRGNIMKMNTHFPEFLDIRLRMYCEKWIYVSKVFLKDNGNVELIQNYNKALTPEQNKKLYALCQPVIRKLIGVDFENRALQPYLLKASKFFDMYDTEELITPDIDDNKKVKNKD